MSDKLTPNDPYFVSGAQWQLKAMDAERAWALHTGRQTTKIGVADTGGFNHDDFKDSNGVSRVLPGLNTYDGGSTDTVHPNHHGLECMGAIGATGNNGVGVAGAHWNCRLIPIKISEPTSRGWGTPDSVAAGIRAGGDFGCRSLNLSWGLGDTDTMSQNAAFYQSAIDYAFDRGCLTFIISGNQGLNTYLNQDQLQRCVVVGASTRDGHREPISNFGEWVTVVAPLGGTNSTVYSYRTIDYGTRVPSTTKLWPSISGYTEDFWGTSAATPLTCGVEALSDISDNLTCYQRIALVKRAVNKLDARWHDELFSAFGQVSMLKIVQIASLDLPGAAPRPTVIAATPQHNSSVYLGANDTVSFEALVFDENSVESVSLFLDGSETPFQTLNAEPYVFNWTPTTTGVHTFQFKAVSASGVGRSSVDTIHVLSANSADPPFVGIISHRDGQEVSGTIDVAAVSSVYSTLVQDAPGAVNPCWYAAPYINTFRLCMKQNGVEIASLPQVTTGGVWGQLTIPANVTGAVTLEATAVASNGLTSTSSVTLEAVVTSTVGVFPVPSVSLRPVVSAPAVAGVQRGSFSMPAVSLRPAVVAPALVAAQATGAFTMPSVSLRPAVAPLSLVGGGAIRAPSGAPLNLRRTDGSPLQIILNV